MILAAGLGTRMRSNLAKVLHKLDNRPLINHVCRTATTLAPRKIYVVIGHQGEDVKQAVLEELDEEHAEFVWQKEQLGTGDAVNAAREFLENEDSTLLILSGDVPMIRAETLAALVQQHHAHRGKGAACTILTVKLDDPTGYGRIVRDSEGLFDKIVEQKDASDEEKAVNEINSGIYCFDTKKLFDALSKVQNNNSQGEYYLTDVPHLLRDAGEDIAIYRHNDAHEIEGINNRVQLADMERILCRRTIRRMMLDYGVTFIDPKNTYVSEQASIGRDTVIYPNVTIEGDTRIGDGCTIRSGTRISNSKIGYAVEILDNCLIIDSEVSNQCTVGPMAHLARTRENGRKIESRKFRRTQKNDSRQRLESKSSDLSRRRDHRRKNQHRRGNDHLQLRRQKQTRDRDRQQCENRFGHDARRARQSRRQFGNGRGKRRHKRRRTE